MFCRSAKLSKPNCLRSWHIQPIVKSEFITFLVRLQIRICVCQREKELPKILQVFEEIFAEKYIHVGSHWIERCLDIWQQDQ